MIAAHPVQATQVKIKDQAGNIATFAVVESIDGNGYMFMHVPQRPIRLLESLTIDDTDITTSAVFITFAD